MSYAQSRLGHDRLAHSAYRMKSLWPTEKSSQWKLPIFGSDFPVEPPNPFAGMYAATTRCDPGSESCNRDRLWDEERVTRLQAIRGFGRNVAYGGWLEGKGVGQIVEGGWADFVVITEDIFDSTVDLRKITVEETWVAGRKVYSVKPS